MTIKLMHLACQDESVIEMDSQHPLNDMDFRRSEGLTEEDLSPSDGGLSLYSSGYFEGDIIGPKPGLSVPVSVPQL